MLTIVVPTYNRHYCLDRIFNYYLNTDFKIIIADGSDKPLAKDKVLSLPSNTTYHYEKTGVNQRIVNVLPFIKTPYACLLGDDELHLSSTLYECINFLNSNNDYVSCMGLPLGFKHFNNNSSFYVKSIYPELKDHLVTQDLPADRLYYHFNPYVCSSVYAAIRTPAFKLAALAANIRTSCVYTQEISFELSNSAIGKLHIIKKISWLRNFDIPAVSNKSWNRRFRFHHWYNIEKFQGEKMAWIHNLDSLLKPHVKEDLKTTIEKAMEIYVNTCPKDSPKNQNHILERLKNSIKIIIKKTNRNESDIFGETLETAKINLLALNRISDINDFNHAFNLIKKC